MNEEECPNLKTCQLFNFVQSDDFKIPGCTGDQIKKMLIASCFVSWNECKRKQLKDKGEQVPGNMLPSGEYYVKDGANWMFKCRQ